MTTPYHKRAATLVEILIVISIIAIVSATAFLAIVPRVKAAGVQAKCTSSLHTLVLGMNIYMSDNDGMPPPRLEELGTADQISCPIDAIRYDYSGNFVQMSEAGRAEWVGAFDPSRHAVIKCIQHIKFDGEYRLFPMTNVFGQRILRRVPVLKENEALIVLSGYLDGSVRFGPFVDDYMTDMDRICPPPTR